jgi:hypothetical protein
MNKSIIVAFIATLAVGTVFAAGHTAAPSTSAGAASKDVTGKTEDNREGKMSPTGQNETSSVAPPKNGTTNSTSTKAPMGAAGADTTDASGKTQANREGRMSPTGQNESTSATPKQNGAATK